KGMGKKTAEKIIVELRDRVIAPVGGSSAADASPIVHISSGDEDAVVALISLGFTRAESERAVSRAKQQGAKTVEDIIMLALKGM
ncbi:MAG: Holliday junction branch migration protein RuvA, partial [Clostridia bacterium]|nr:Holliday junction branch migration protein RuvA [Clostridia bacterium]